MTKSFATTCGLGLALVVSIGAPAADELPAEKNEPLTIGQMLPEFESVMETGQLWKSADHAGRKVLVFYFYPGDFTGGCIKQAQSFREGLKSLEDIDVEVVGVSGDEVATHRLFKQSHDLTHTLLADPQGLLAARLGIPTRRQDVPAKVRAVDLDRKPLVDEQGQPIVVERKITYPRWTIIIDGQGKLVSKRMQVNPATDAEEVRKVVESLAIGSRGSGRAGPESK
jgi:peroxiredoxin Q/BCP